MNIRIWMEFRKRAAGLPFRIARWSAAAVLACVWLVTAVPASADCNSLTGKTNIAEQKLDKARSYFQSGHNPTDARRKFLALNDENRTPKDPPHRSLGTVIDDLVELSWCTNANLAERERIDNLLHQATQLSLQGWSVSGNLALMEGLRIAYPRPNQAGSMLNREQPPYRSLEEKYGFLSIDDATRATLFYDEGIRVLLASLRRRPKSDRAPVIVDVDTEGIPNRWSELTGYFNNEKFPQYTYYVDDNERIVPIRTQGYMMGNLLQKQGQATQTIGYRLWTAAYFNRQSRDDPKTRKDLLDGAVEELRIGANSQFLSSIALAATVGDKAVTTGETPYQIDRLYHAQSNLDQARRTMTRIQSNEKPVLPIDEIMAGDDQVNGLIGVIESPNEAGSIARAGESYEAAKSAINIVYSTQEAKFNEEQTRQENYIARLENLTGEPITESRHENITKDTIRTASGQRLYLTLVEKRISEFLESTSADYDSLQVKYGPIASTLGDAMKQVIVRRQTLKISQDERESYQSKIEINRDLLEKNIESIQFERNALISSQAFRSFLQTSMPDTEYILGFIPVTKLKTSELAVGATRVADLGIRADRQLTDLRNATNAQKETLLLDAITAHERTILAKEELDQAIHSVEITLNDAKRILAQLNRYEADAVQLWYNDPIWDTGLTYAEEAANRDLNSLIANLYELGRLLQIRWIEPFSNPVSVDDGEPKHLGGSGEFDNFWGLESVFNLSSVDVRNGLVDDPPHIQAAHFLSALKAWDRTLRENRRFEGDLNEFTISLREDVFGLPDLKKGVGGDGEVLDINSVTNLDFQRDVDIRRENIRRFQNILINTGLFVEGDRETPRGFCVNFPLLYHSRKFSDDGRGYERLFGGANAWNYRVEKLKLRFIPIPGRTFLVRKIR